MSGPFRRTTLIVVVLVAVISGAIAIGLTLRGDDVEARRTGYTNTYSRSAIGYRGLVRLLEQLDIPVVVSTSDPEKKSAHGLLVIAEPDLEDEAARARLWTLVTGAERVLVVLPKWYGYGPRGQPWIDRVFPVEISRIDKVLDAIAVPETRVVRRIPERWTAVDGWSARPAIRQPQLVASSTLERVVGDGRGRVLLGKIVRSETSELWVLTDPDVLNNVGLRSAENARFAVEIIENLRKDGSVVFDETMHGYIRPPSLTSMLLEFPLVIATVQIGLCILLVMWAAAVRFGPRRPSPPPLAPGKDFLIRNTAALLHYGGHHAEALRKYLQGALADVRHALHAPALSAEAVTEWIDRVGATRGCTMTFADLQRAVEAGGSPQRVLEVASRIHRWRTEMTHGIDRRP